MSRILKPVAWVGFSPLVGLVTWAVATLVYGNQEQAAVGNVMLGLAALALALFAELFLAIWLQWPTRRRSGRR